MKGIGGRILSFFLGFLFGIIALVGGIVGGGIWFYKNGSINKTEEILKTDLTFLDAFLSTDSAFRGKTIEQIIAEAAAIPNKTFGDLETEYGVIFPEQLSFLTDSLLDVQINAVAGSIGSVVTGIKIGSVLGAPYNDFVTYPETYEGPAPENTTALMWVMRNYTINELSGSLLEEIKIGSLLGEPYSDFVTYPTTYEGASPAGTDSMLWTIRGYTINGMSQNLLNNVLIGNILGAPYNDFVTYPTTYEGASPVGADSMLWAIRGNTINNMSTNLLSTVKIGSILGAPYNDFVTYPTTYEGASPVGAESLLWAIRGNTINNMSSNLLSTVKIGSILGAPYNDYVTYPESYMIDELHPLPTGATAMLWDLRNFTIQGETNGISTYPNTLTVDDLKTVFGVNLPAMLNDNIPGSTPISEMGPEIDNLYIYDIIDAPAAEEDQVTKNIITKIRFLKKDGTVADPTVVTEPQLPENDWYKFSEFNTLLTDLPAALSIQDVLTDPSANPDGVSKTFLQKIYDRNSKLTELGTDLPLIIDGIYVYELINAPDAAADHMTTSLINKIRSLRKDGSVLAPDTVDPPPDSDWYKISEFNSLLTGLTAALTIQDVLTDPSANPDGVSKTFMQKIYDRNSKLTQLGTDLPDIIDKIYIHEIISAPDAAADHMTTSLINKIRGMKTGEPGMEDFYTLGGFNNLLGNLSTELTIQDIIAEPDIITAPVDMGERVLHKVWNSNAQLKDLSTVLTSVFLNLEFKDILDTPVNADSVSGRIINKLRNETDSWKVTQIETAIASFTFGDLYPDTTGTGILSLINPLTPLDSVPTEMERIITETTMIELYNKGLIATQPEAAISNMTLDEIVALINSYTP